MQMEKNERQRARQHLVAAMLAGQAGDHPPFDGDSPVVVAMQHIQDVPKSPGQFNPNIPTALEEIMMRCLEKATDMRFSDGSQLARSLIALV
jgi:hypothetical protein